MNFRTRASLTIALLTAVALGGAFTAVSAAFNGLQREQLDLSLLAVARQEAAEASRHGFAFSDRPGPAANDVGPLTKYGVIYDEHGMTLSATAPFDVRPPSPTVLQHSFDTAFDLYNGGDHLRGVLVRIPNQTGKRLFLSASRDDLDGDEAFLFHAMLVAFIVALLWAAIVAHWMGGRLTRDHEAIAVVARRVSGGDLSARVVVRARDPEIVQLGRDINEMVERLDVLMRSQRRFIAHAAHELRSPLTALYGELQQALRRERDAAGYRSAIVSALSAAKRLTLLAEDLLTLARTKDDVDSPSAAIEVEKAVALACEHVRELARSRDVTVTVNAKLPCAIADLSGDTTRLLRNLLENAIRHSPSGEQVLVEVGAHERTVEISVSDRGPGIDAGEREMIFEPFFRGKHSAGTDGTGLGLGIAREIARAHGGDLLLGTDDLGSGATFVVSLPNVQPPALHTAALTDSA